jgi:acetyl-CoA synthetase
MTKAMWCLPRGRARPATSAFRIHGRAPFQTIWGDRERYVSQLLCSAIAKNPDSKDWRDWPYLAGDAAVEAKDGYYRILGRIDDVINVSGHRLGTKEIESAALVVPEVAEAAVVPVAHEIKGANPTCMFPQPGHQPSTAWPNGFPTPSAPRSERSPSRAKCGSYGICPKPAPARSCGACWGRISNNRDAGDVSTLANPEIVAEIRQMIQG